MSLLNNLLSSIDPTAAPKPSNITGARQTQPASGPKPASRPAASINGVSQAQPLKRKADGLPEGGQVKVQRKDGTPSLSRPGTPGQTARPNGVNRPLSASDTLKSKPPTPAPSIPYRGTAASGGLTLAKPQVAISRKPTIATTTNAPPNNSAKAANPSVKPATSSTTTATSQPVKKGYAAMLQKAKEREQTKAPTPPVKNEPTKILSKKEREALRAQAKGKKPPSTIQAKQAKAPELKGKVPERSKSVGYQGTARPIKKPVETGYKGTARPNSVTPGAVGKTGASSAARAKSKQPQRRDDGYANWSDLDDMDDEEEDYESAEDLSDMEGGIWDVEEEEQMALKVARKEDAEALAEENEHKRQKEERKRKLMNLAASAKKKY
ncbi:hypothetical protein B0J11DRAFT_530530 [Dendryphion nanum]|uniref:SPT2 chromatin protein n=1 Tax=Dendryphion nanum TaxID=256645 RepID=A0A9P9IKQ0_9PLEO|nr:hypothetical protein B0J11DRAFT_530530 [Dendryphion nanum]